mgnify:CR=1 FL=1
MKKFDTCEHALLIVDEELWVWGRNSEGQLGLGHCFTVYKPTRVDYGFDGSGVKSVKCTGTISLVLTNAGNIYCCGSSFSKQLNEDYTLVNRFIQYPYLKNVSMINSSYGCCYAVSDGKLYTWGRMCINEQIVWNFKPNERPIGQVYKIACDNCSSIILTDEGLWYFNEIKKHMKLNFDDYASIIEMDCSCNVITIMTRDMKLFWCDHSRTNIIDNCVQLDLIKPKLFLRDSQILILHESPEVPGVRRLSIINRYTKTLSIYEDDTDTVHIFNNVWIDSYFYISGNVVYCKGDNKRGTLGLDHTNSVPKYIQHEFLSGKKLIDNDINKICRVKNARS